jgi:putative ABC transport system ATP-binding protein
MTVTSGAAHSRLIHLEGVGKTYGGNPANGSAQAKAVTVLQDVDLSIENGEFTALQGASGSGKSTLLHILGLLDRPTTGRYLLRGKDVAGMDDDALSEQRNRHIGFVFQSFYLIPYATAVDNVLMPGLYGHESQRTLTERAHQLLELVGLADRTGFRPAQLSGGQQQRVALARALINQPDLLLADEPTGQLDSTTSKEIMQLIQRINGQGTTVVLVTHDADTAAFARRVVRVEDGRIASEG